MIIDVHSYFLGSNELYKQKSVLLAERGWGDNFRFPPIEAIHHYGDNTVSIMDRFGVDVRLIGPRPYHLMTAEKPASIVHAWIAMTNDVIAMQCAQHPTRLRGLIALPQVAGEPVEVCLDELQKRAADPAFVGALINPDPSEGTIPTRGMGDPYWYPLYEQLEALDMPAVIAGGTTRHPRQTYRIHYIVEPTIAALSILENRELFDRFPNLKLIIGYGGGSIPYQVGRWRARSLRMGDCEGFDARLRRLWFDTVVHSPEAMEMLLEVCGPDRCLFGTTQPGAATTTNPRTGKPYDQLAPVIEAIDWLTAEQRMAIFEGNARQVFTRL